MKKSILNKIVGTIGVASVVAGTTLGIHYGFQKKKSNFKKSPSDTSVKKFFDNNLIASNSTYVLDHIITPPNDGHSLISDVTPINQSYFGDDKIKRLIDKDSNGEYIGIKEYEIDVEKIGSQTNLENELKEINNDIYQYVNSIKISNGNSENKTIEFQKQLGVFVYTDANSRKIKISLLQLNEIENPKLQMIKDFIDDLGEINLNDLSEDNFFWPFAADTFFSAGGYENWNHWTFGANPKDSNYDANRKKPRELFYDKWHGNNNGKHDWWEDDNHFTIDKNEKKWKRKEDNENNISLNVIQNLWNNGIAPIMTPTINLDDKTFSLAIKFYELDEESSIVDYENKDYVFNSKGIYTIVKKSDLTLLGDSVSLDQNQTNRDIIKKFITQDLPKYMEEPLVNPGLNLIGKLIPTLAPLLRDWQELAGSFKKYPEIKAIFDQVQNPNDPLAQYKGNALLDTIIDLISNNKAFKTNDLLEIIKSFENDMPKFWANMQKLTYLDSQGEFKLYNLVDGIHSFFGTLQTAIKKVYPSLNIIQDSSDIVDDLLTYLKTENILDSDTQIKDILTNPYKILGSIFDYGLTKDLVLPKKYVEIIVNLLNQFGVNFANKTSMDDATDLLSDFLSKPSGFRLLAKLLTSNGEYKAQEVILNIVQNPSEGIKLISENDNINQSEVLEIAKIIKSLSLLPSPFDSLILDTHYLAQKVSEWFADGTITNILTSVLKIKSDGISSLTDDEWTSLIDPLKFVFPDYFTDLNNQDILKIINLVLKKGVLNGDNDELTKLLQLIFNILKIEPSDSLPSPDELAPILTSIINEPLGNYLEPSTTPQNNIEDNLTKLMSFVTSLSPSLKDSSIIKLLPEVLIKIGKGFSSEDEFFEFVQKVLPDFDFSVEIPILGKYEDVIKDIYSDGKIAFFDLKGIQKILQSGLKSINEFEMAKTISQVKKLWKLVKLFKKPSDDITKIIDLFLEDSNKTASALTAIITKPIKDIPKEDLKFISTLIGKIMQVDIDKNFLPEIIKFLDSGIADDNTAKKHMAETFAKDLPKLFGSKDNLKILKDIIAGTS